MKNLHNRSWNPGLNRYSSGVGWQRRRNDPDLALPRSGSGAAIFEKASEDNVKVIDYDRLT